MVVNLSDFVVMGVELVWISLFLLLLEVDEVWLDDFVLGFYELI